MRNLNLLLVATVVTAGLVFAPLPPAGSQEESTGTFREVERKWQTLAALAELGGPARDVKIVVNWIPDGLSSHWYQHQRGKGPFEPIPAERVVRVLAPAERDRFLEGLRPHRALRGLTNSASAGEVGAGGAGIVAIATFELSAAGGEKVRLKLDVTGLRARGGTGQAIYSGYLAELFDELALEHVGRPLPQSVMETVSGEEFIRASRAAYRLERFERNPVAEK